MSLQMRKIQQKLEEADERDKKGIALIGIAQATTNTKTALTSNASNAAVSLDKDCMNCGNNSTVITKAFKMACLSYEPSEVAWDSKKWLREELMKFRRQLLTDELKLFLQSKKKKVERVTDVTEYKVEKMIRRMNSPPPAIISHMPSLQSRNYQLQPGKASSLKPRKMNMNKTFYHTSYNKDLISFNMNDDTDHDAKRGMIPTIKIKPIKLSGLRSPVHVEAKQAKSPVNYRFPSYKRT